MPDITFIDLFSGCGGFSLGLRKAGLRELASIDFNPEAIKVFRANFPEVPFVLEKDLTQFQPQELSILLGTDHVDVVVGGPPCQGFSMVRQADGANSGSRLIEDERRNLFLEFLKFVKFFRPKIFIMENVPGIQSAVEGYFFTAVQKEARFLGYRVHGEMVQAWEYGVPQKRRRQLIIGTKLNLPLFSSQLYMIPTHGSGSGMHPLITLWEAIGDLPTLEAGEGEAISNYDFDLRNQYLQQFDGRYLLETIEIERAETLTAHIARRHSDRDIRDFKRLKEGENGKQAIDRGEIMEFPYDRNVFKDRYTRQHRQELCSTIVAHLSKDGLMFIHPTQDRSLTPREAARIQSFPDWFNFPVSQMHQYRLIGNAVPPQIGLMLGQAIGQWINDSERGNVTSALEIPRDESQAVEWLLDLIVCAKKTKIINISPAIFKKGWFAIGFLFGYLHPDSAITKDGKTIVSSNGNNSLLRSRAPELTTPIYELSGWPVKLVPFVIEARNRLRNGNLSKKEFYCSEAFIQGLYQ